MKLQIFKTGKQTDSNGIERTWTAADLDQIAAAYNPANHEAPVVIGHPKDNAPAFGWVEKVWREGETLWAGLKDLVPEFVDLVKQGLFKKRSISLYPDLTLRHIGFLGAMPPAVKGLADIQFTADEGATYEFGDDAVGAVRVRAVREPPLQSTNNDSIFRKEEKQMTFKEWLTQMKNAFLTMPEDQIPAGDLPGATKEAEQTFSEAEVRAQVEEAKKQAEIETRKIKDAEFAETARQNRQDSLKTEIASWCESMVAKGQLTPALVKYGLPELLFQAAQAEGEMEFGEEKIKAEPLARWKEFFEKQLPAVVSFKEVATREKDPGTGTAGERLTALTHKLMDEKKELTFSEAFSSVQIANRDLALEYAEELRGGK